MAQAIKFLHTSDLHLDRAVEGLADIPPHLKATIANAPYLAAENIFQLAVAEKVDFVLLAGDVVDLDAGGPRAAAFLLSQFERLAERSIRVYWCSGKVDQPDRWPAAASLPENVHTFTSTGFDATVHHKDRLPVATIYGTGYYSSRNALADLRLESETVFPIVLAYPSFDSPACDSPHVRYWALGGNHAPSMVERPSSYVVFPGTPQARCNAESGAHGCALVRVDVTGKVRVEQMPVDLVRWMPQSLSFAESASDEDIKNILADRGLKIAADTPDQIAVIDWRVATTGDFNPRLRHSAWRQKMISWLRTEFGASNKGLWTTDFVIDPSRTLPQHWYDEDTMLGDYLRTISRFQADPRMTIPLQSFTPGSSQEEWLGDMARIDDTSRENILRDAMLMGIERLGAFAEDR